MTTVTLRNAGAVRIATMDRPEALNAFSRQLIDDLADTFLDAAADASIKVLVLTGAGRAFSAGADLKEMGAPQLPSRHGFAVMLEAIIDFPKPFVVAVNGLGAGIGATICGLADLVFMSTTARLRCPFSALGLTAEAASTFTFPRLLGHQRAMWFLLSSEWMDARACFDAGLALELFEPDALMDRSVERAQTLAALPLASLAKTKALVLDPIRARLKAAAAAENQGLAELLGGAANREALRAFRDKRPPDFSGL